MLFLVVLHLIPAWTKIRRDSSILFDSFPDNSPMCSNFDIPFVKEVMIKSMGSSSIIEGTNFFGQFMDFSELLLTIIEPTSSPDIFLKFVILILAFIFSFKTFIKAILVGLQRTLLMTNLEFGDNSASAIINAAELGSELTV